MNKKDSLFDEVNDLQDELKSYIQARIDFTKLQVAEDISKILSQTAINIVLFYVFFFVLMLTSIAGAFAIGTITGCNELGFLIIGGVYFLLAVIIYIFKKPLIETPIIKSIVHLFFPNFNKYDKQS